MLYAVMPAKGGGTVLIDTRHLASVSEMGTWRVRDDGYTSLCRKKPGGPRSRGAPRETLLLHKVILAIDGVSVGPGLEPDHVNGDPSDNRSCNLRVCTHQQNTFNRKKRIDGVTSRFKGVCWYRHPAWKQPGKWAAAIRVNGKRHHLGYFDVEEDAAEAYRVAALAHFGQFACQRGEP